MELLSHILQEAKRDDLKEILSKDIKLQVIDFHGISRVHSQTQSECLNLTLWDGFDEIQAKVITDILNSKFVLSVSSYCSLTQILSKIYLKRTFGENSQTKENLV